MIQTKQPPGNPERFTLVDIGKPDAVAGCILDIGGKALYRGPVADIGRSDMQGKQVAECAYGQMHLRPPLAPAPS